MQRASPDGQKGATGDALVSMLLDQIAILKRPIFVAESGVSVGFDDAQRKNMVAQK
jgi:arsenate reductase-like glutaredoxin family protein